jgi:hypothetical protein
VGSRHQEQNRDAVKAQNGQYMASWVGLLLLVSEPNLTGCLVVPTGASSSLSGLDFHIPYRRVRDWWLTLLRVLVATCHTRFGASGSDVGLRHQEYNHDGVKAQSGQYMAS